MLFIQQFTRNEYIFGDRTIIVAVSDSYSELLNSEVFTETNILEIEETDSSLDIEKGAASKGELSFSIKQAACVNEADLNVLFFCLDASNDDVGRYIAIWIDNRQNSDCEFIGKISSKISGDDKFWDAGAYAMQIDPVREYKFTAYSIDLEILQQVKLLSQIKIESGVIDSLYKRIDMAEIKNIFKHHPLFHFEDVPLKYFYSRPTGNLYSAIQYLLTITTDIVNEILGSEIEFILTDSYLGVQSSHVSYINHSIRLDAEGTKYPSITNLTHAGAKLKWKLDPVDKDPLGEWASVFISEKMLIPKPWDEDPLEMLRIDSNSFNQYDNVASLLQGIARSLGCYLIFNYLTATQISITMVPRGELTGT